MIWVASNISDLKLYTILTSHLSTSSIQVLKPQFKNDYKNVDLYKFCKASFSLCLIS